MGLDFYTDLVDEAWLRELVAAWTARDAKQPVPPVRWPESKDKTREYLSHLPYDWPDEFRRMISSRTTGADLPDGNYWYHNLDDLVAALGLNDSRSKGLANAANKKCVQRFLEFAEPFMFYSHRRNDYGPQDYFHVLSPVTCSRLESVYPEIDFVLLQTVIAQAIEKNAAEEQDEELRWYFGGREPNQLLRDFCAHCRQCCRESRESGWALCLSVC